MTLLKMEVLEAELPLMEAEAPPGGGIQSPGGICHRTLIAHSAYLPFLFLFCLLRI